jgi:hypothetical protein
MDAKGRKINTSPTLVAVPADGFRGWTVETKFGTATVRDEGDHLMVRVPVCLQWGCHWSDGERYDEKNVQGAPNLARPKITHLNYRARVGTSPVMAVRFALVHGWQDGE